MLNLPVRVMFQDEARFGRLSDPRRCWAPAPLRPTVGLALIREYTYAYAAVSPQEEYWRTRRWNWVLLFRTRGMPSSHSALVAGVAHGVGLYSGLDSSIFAVAFALAIVVIYDATGIRRQAGKHARMLNSMIEDLAAGHPLKEEQLHEFLGHTPLEALAGMLLGIASAQIGWMLWH